MLYLFFCTDKPEHAEVRAANRQAHLDYLAGFAEHVLLAGPTLGDNGTAMTGSLLVLDFAERAEADAFAANDPYAKAGLFDSVVVRPFKKVLPEA